LHYAEYGKENPDVIILLHGGGLSWWNYRDEALKLMHDFHVVLPILDGHAQSDADFTTIEENAARIIEFIDCHFAGSVLFMGGLSLGGQILLEILSRRKNICQYALIESALVLPSKATYAMISPAIKSCYGLVRRRWFARLQFKSLRIRRELFEAYFQDTCGISRDNLIAFLQANALYSINPSLTDCTAKVSIFIGEKEKKSIRKSAEIIHEKIQGSSLHILAQRFHGEFSINHADEYANQVRKMIQSR